MSKLFLMVTLGLLLPSITAGGSAIAGNLPGSGKNPQFRLSTGVHPLLFRLRENGKDTQSYLVVSLTSYTSGSYQGAQFDVTALYYNRYDRKMLDLVMQHYSTDDGSISNLRIDANSISFNFDWASGGGAPLSFVATKARDSTRFKASAVGVWTGALGKQQLIRVEWEQLQSINLPASIIKY